MPSLSSHHSSDYVKLLLVGDAKSGKTGSLVSLVKAGYKLRIVDLDNLLDFFAKQVRNQCPDKLENIEYRTLRDHRKMTDAGPVIDGAPRAFVSAIKMLDKWKYDDVDLGSPSSWGTECILIIDSLSRLCDAAYDWAAALASKNSDGRAIYGNAQDAIENVLAGLTSDRFATNVIVIAHGMYMDLEDGTKKIFPQGVGQKLSPKIPQYFPSYIRYKNLGGKRTIQLESDPMIDLANPRPEALPKTLPMDTGLADFFAALKAQPKPQKITLKRIENEQTAARRT